jgi:alpha-N-arabinofuranosidase
VQNNDFYFLFVVMGAHKPVIRLVKRAHGADELLAERPVRAGSFALKVEAHEQSYSFYASVDPDHWETVAEGVDGRILSTPIAGGFVGTTIAMVASSSGAPSTNSADFDWFEYVGLDAH